MPRIVIIEPNKQDQPYSVSLDTKRLSIGRAAGCDIKLDEPSISSNHCNFLRVPGGYIVEDLGSTNGLKVNGERFDRIGVASNETITLGREVHIDLQFSDEEVAYLQNEGPAPLSSSNELPQMPKTAPLPAPEPELPVADLAAPTPTQQAPAYQAPPAAAPPHQAPAYQAPPAAAPPHQAPAYQAPPAAAPPHQAPAYQAPPAAAPPHQAPAYQAPPAAAPPHQAPTYQAPPAAAPAAARPQVTPLPPKKANPLAKLIGFCACTALAILALSAGYLTRYYQDEIAPDKEETQNNNER
ncbi:FHA domain-containing protein [Rubritalea marina]|uniref:FHA domain-containing protein n=1 Tax=Rubritalea marina TaxID=361055 RepID=UPI0003817AEC|nr:FHA domain-containing protein [Rubritalea marina]